MLGSPIFGNPHMRDGRRPPSTGENDIARDDLPFVIECLVVAKHRRNVERVGPLLRGSVDERQGCEAQPSKRSGCFVANALKSLLVNVVPKA